jgi:hypothetical protein
MTTSRAAARPLTSTTPWGAIVSSPLGDGPLHTRQAALAELRRQ